MSEKHTAIQTIKVTAGCTVPVKLDFYNQLDRRNSQLLNSVATPTIDIGTSGDITIANEQVNASAVWIDAEGTQPRQAAIGEAVLVDVTFDATLNDSLYRMKVVATDADGKTLPAKWVLFEVETGKTSV